jgi:hypothetical protein
LIIAERRLAGYGSNRNMGFLEIIAGALTALPSLIGALSPQPPPPPPPPPPPEKDNTLLIAGAGLLGLVVIGGLTYAVLK